MTITIIMNSKKELDFMAVNVIISSHFFVVVTSHTSHNLVMIYNQLGPNSHDSHIGIGTLL